ncbi:MFS transporter [Ochrobactrum pecoris]|uniref:MFS transporter (Putative signal transducer) n=1 Tax=Brucella pecoris TaxID=867683 RepID=A0AB34YZG0_9HYPH|nr:MFS transporter [Brucella pecoris]MBB4096200.1 MFS transporter (putative signal transducer) [Brucella pecoris]NKW81764.1 MFS transporter [Brucella pecoris]
MVGTRNLTAVASLNVVQGLPAYFFTLGLPALMREAGASLDVVALTYIVWLPWALKWLWAPRFDQPVTPPFGARIHWMRALPVFMAAAFAVLLLMSPASHPVFLLSLALIGAVIGATLQVVLAAFVLERFSEDQRATANALQVAGMTAGSFLGGGVLLYLGDWLGWHAGIVMVVVLLLLASLPAWLIGIPAEADRLGRPVETLAFRPWKAVSQSSGLVVIIMVLGAGAAAGDALIAAIMIDKGFSSSDVGWMLGMVALGIMIPVSGLAGMLVHTLGAGRSLALLLLFKAALSATLAFANSIDPAALAMVSVVSFSLGAATMVAFWQIYMSNVDPAHSATGFAFFTSLEALLLMIAGIGGGQIAALTGTTWLYALSSIAALMCAFAIMISSRVLEV